MAGANLREKLENGGIVFGTMRSFRKINNTENRGCS